MDVSGILGQPGRAPLAFLERQHAVSPGTRARGSRGPTRRERSEENPGKGE